MKKLKIAEEERYLTFEDVAEHFYYLKYKVHNRYYNFLKANFSMESEDIMQELDIALYKAYERYDITKNIDFSTYVYNYLNFAFHNYVRSYNNRVVKSIISLNSQVSVRNGADTEIIELLESSCNLEDSIVFKLDLKQKIDKLDNIDKQIFSMLLDAKTQQEIAKKLNKQQSFISRHKLDIIKKNKEE